MVSSLLERAGAKATRPEELGDEFGLQEDGYHLSERQAQAILDLRLHRLTGLEQDKIVADYEELLAKVDDLLDILGNPARLMSEIRGELEELRETYADPRRTEIRDVFQGFNREDLVTPEDVVVTLSHEGYIKAQSLGEYRAQRRGGRGKTAARTKEEDFVAKLFIAHTHDTMLRYSSRGKVYWLKVYEVPRRVARAVHLSSTCWTGRTASAFTLFCRFAVFPRRLCLHGDRKRDGQKTRLVDFSRPRSAGIIAVDLVDGDELAGVAITDGMSDIMLFSDNGKCIRFKESDGVRWSCLSRRAVWNLTNPVAGIDRDR